MNQIVCPNCNHAFAITDSVDKELQAARDAAKASIEKEKNEMRAKMNDFIAQKEKEFEAKQKQAERDKVELEKKIKEAAAAEYSVKMEALEKEKKERLQQLQEMQRNEIELLRQKEVLELKQKDIELDVEKKLIAGRKQIEEEVLLKEKELHDLKMKEKETQLESMKKTIEDLKRKSEQGSMQTQGEAQEILLEEALQENFPYDSVIEVGKGVEGADCILEIKNRVGQVCGSIIFESKNTKAFAKAWIEKLKTDKRNKNADIAVLVTQTFPKEMTHYGEVEGIWICSFKEAIPLIHVLRSGILNVYEAQKNQENKGDKMHLLYEFLTGIEFKGQIEGIVEGFIAMKSSIDKERITMEKIWKEREKQIQKVLLSTSGMYGSIKGIAGASVSDIPLLEGE